MIIAPSILNADNLNLETDIKEAIAAGINRFHIDIMDGMFVPSISMGFPVMKSIRPLTDRIFDVHLMIQEPERYINEFVDAGADLLTVHAEACTNLERTIQKIKEKGIIAGVAIKPSTPVEQIAGVLKEVDMVLVMMVNPGFGGQKLIPGTIDKVWELKQMINEMGLETDIEVDGGVTLDNVGKVMDAGANIVVAGSAIFHGDVEDNVRQFLSYMSE